jgi:2-polyprenyl-6-methoxyphenol hydroxylase-like FAD-dependent oxidoreductase
VDTDVLIAGAGPVGLALALELTRQGAACRIVDAQPEPHGTFSRATELQARALVEVLPEMRRAPIAAA